MIVDLPSTTTKEISKRLVTLRNNVGAMAMGRVLTLLVSTDEAGADTAVQAANDATRQHPARIVVLVRGNRRGRNRLDAQIRVGGDAGASEIVVLRLYGRLADHAEAVVTPLLLPDSPIVAWWPDGTAPADVAGTPLGAMAHRRITDASAGAKPSLQLRRRAEHYRPGDTDLAWTRITRWRAVLAASLEHPPYEPVTAAMVTAEAESPSADLLAGWLGQALDLDVGRARSGPGTGLVSVRLERACGPVDLVTGDSRSLATLAQPGQPVRQVPLAEPSLPECLADELRRLDADEVYAMALCEGLPRVRRPVTRTQAIRAGRAPDDTLSLAERVRAHTFARTLLREQVEAGPEELAAAVARELDQVVAEAVATRGSAHVVLTGGSMGSATVRALAELRPDPTTWQRVHLWWGDERFVPAGDADRNDQQAEDAGLGDLGVPVDQVHRVPVAHADDGPGALAEAAAAYAELLARHAARGAAVPDFDVVLLGLGPDTHVASLFPGREELTVTGAMTVPVTDSPKPPPDRVSLTVPALNAAERVWLVVAGADKAAAVVAARGATDDPEVPASWVRGRGETVWWLDQAAASG